MRSVQTVKVCKRRNGMELLWKSLVFSKLLLNARDYLCYHAAFFPLTAIHLAHDIPPSKLYTYLYIQPHGLFQELLDTGASPCKAEPAPLITRWASHLEICAFGACFGLIILYLNLSTQLHNAQNRAGSVALRLRFFPCCQRITWALWISQCSLSMSR